MARAPVKHLCTETVLDYSGSRRGGSLRARGPVSVLYIDCRVRGGRRCVDVGKKREEIVDGWKREKGFSLCGSGLPEISNSGYCFYSECLPYILCELVNGNFKNGALYDVSLLPSIYTVSLHN